MQQKLYSLHIKKSVKYCSAALAIFTLAGCFSAPPRPLTPEEQEFQRKAMEALLNKMSGASQPYSTGQLMAQPAQPEVHKPQVGMTAEELKSAISSLPAPSGFVSFERSRDGMLINGQMLLDPEGKIVNFGYNGLTGEYTYVTQTEPNVYSIKYNRAESGQEPILLATARRQGEMFNLESVTGKKLSGEGFLPTSRGVVVTRGTSAFAYDPMSGVKSFSATNGFHIAQFQRGDIGSTGYILLERNEQTHADQENPVNAIANVFDAVADAGNAFGVIDHASHDYMLVNIKTGESIPLDISLRGKQVGDFSNCRTKKSYAGGAFRLNQCEHVDYRESLYNNDGSPNYGHYFWKIHWFNTHDDTYAIAQEAGLRKITITELSSGKKVTALERALGIQSFNVEQNEDGIISINARMGFSSESIPDAIDFFHKHQMLSVSE